MSKFRIEVEIDSTNPAQVAAACVFMQTFENSSAQPVAKTSRKKVEIPVKLEPITKVEVVSATPPAPADKPGEVAKLGSSVRTLITAKVQAHRPEIKAKLEEIGVPNVTKLIEAKDIEKLMTMMTFLEALA